MDLREELYRLATSAPEHEFHQASRSHIMHVPWMEPFLVKGYGDFADEAYRNLCANVHKALDEAPDDDLRFWKKCWDEHAAKKAVSAEAQLASLLIDLANANALVKADPALSPMGLAELAMARQASYQACWEELSRLRKDLRFCLREWAHEDVPPLDAAQAERWSAYANVADILSRLVDGVPMAQVLSNMPKLYCSQCFGPHPLPCPIHPDDKGR